MEAVNVYSKVFVPLTGTVNWSNWSFVLGSYPSIPAGQFMSGAIIIDILPAPAIVMVNLPASSVVKLFFCKATSIVNFPTAPLNEMGLSSSGSGFTIIFEGLLCKLNFSSTIPSAGMDGCVKSPKKSFISFLCLLRYSSLIK